MALDPITQGALITAGGNIVSNLLGDDDDKWTAQDAWLYRDQRRIMQRSEDRAYREARRVGNLTMKREDNALVRRVADAKRAGLHPLAAIGAQLSPVTPMQSPGPGGAPSASTGGGPTGDARRDAIRMTAAQIGQMVADRKEAQSRTRLNEAQAAVLEKELKVGSPGAPPYPQPPGLAEGHDVRNPQFTSMVSPGFRMSTNPNFSDAQTYEDRYGEVGGSMLGLINIPADAWQTAVDAVADYVSRNIPRLITNIYEGQ